LGSQGSAQGWSDAGVGPGVDVLAAPFLLVVGVIGVRQGEVSKSPLGGVLDDPLHGAVLPGVVERGLLQSNDPPLHFTVLYGAGVASRLLVFGDAFQQELG
jgi:hypothetical protein